MTCLYLACICCMLLPTETFSPTTSCRAQFPQVTFKMIVRNDGASKDIFTVKEYVEKKNMVKYVYLYTSSGETDRVIRTLINNKVTSRIVENLK